MQDGLPSNMVYYVFQDSKKFIWFATDAGVSRYDGTTFINYRKKDGLANNDIIRIKEDSSGRIWFFHFNGSLSYIFRNKIYSETNTSILKSLEGKEFYFDFLQDSDSTLYFYNRFSEIIVLDINNKIHRYNLFDKLWQSFPSGYSLGRDLYLRKITKSANGGFIFWTRNGLFELKNLTDIPLLILPLNPIYNVFQMDQNTLFVNLYKDMLYKYNDEQLVDSIHLPLFTMSSLKSVLVGNEDIFWIADYIKGVYCLRRDSVLYRFDIQKPQSILRDHEDNIWIGSVNDGVYKVSPYLLSHLHYPNSFFQQKGIINLTNEWSGGVWLTNGKQVHLLKQNKFYELLFENAEDNINFICQVNNSSLILGENGGAFYAMEGLRMDPSTNLVKFRRSEKIPDSFKDIAIQRDGAGIGAFSITSLYLSDRYSLFRKEAAFDLGQRIYSIFYDLNDNLIVNCRKMFFFRKNQLVPCTSLSRFDNKAITSHLNIGETTELFSIEGDSIYLFSNNIFHNLTNAFGTRIDPQIRNIIYHEPSLYMSTSRNVYKCDNPLAIITNSMVKLQIIDVNFRNIHNILVNNDSLYIASDDGLTVIPETSMTKMKTTIPIPYISSIFVNDQKLDPSDSGFTARGSVKIAFSLGCINYSTAPVIYAYKMDGLDTSWTTGTSGNVIYQHLLNGKYTFKLKVRKTASDAGWSEVTEYPVEIRASFWQHPLFFTTLGLLMLCLITVIIIRRKNIQIKHRELDHHLVTLELKSLQSMMNPHFIFNALSSIQNFLLQNKTGEAGLYLSQFARLIRQNMNALNESMINLDEEFDRLSNYLDLECLRMEKKFTYKIDIDSGFDPEDIMIPSMIIQPFVENSIWHGISAMEDKGFISIIFSLQENHSLKVIITDNGIGIRKAQEYNTSGDKHLKLGMEMTRKRLELLGRKFSVKTRIEFSEAFPGHSNPGTTVVLIIPFSYVS